MRYRLNPVAEKKRTCGLSRYSRELTLQAARVYDEILDAPEANPAYAGAYITGSYRYNTFLYKSMCT
jgi:hypothetical protein